MYVDEHIYNRCCVFAPRSLVLPRVTESIITQCRVNSHERTLGSVHVAVATSDCPYLNIIPCRQPTPKGALILFTHVYICVCKN